MQAIFKKAIFYQNAKVTRLKILKRTKNQNKKGTEKFFTE